MPRPPSCGPHTACQCYTDAEVSDQLLQARCRSIWLCGHSGVHCNAAGHLMPSADCPLWLCMYPDTTPILCFFMNDYCTLQNFQLDAQPVKVTDSKYSWGRLACKSCAAACWWRIESWRVRARALLKISPSAHSCAAVGRVKLMSFRVDSVGGDVALPEFGIGAVARSVARVSYRLRFFALVP